MKVALLFAPTPNPAPAYFGAPYGLALLGGLLERAGHTVVGRDYDRGTIDAMMADLPLVLAAERPDLIGLSCLSVNRGSTIAAVRRVRELAPDTPIILGGPFPTLDPELMFRRCPCDIVCVGDGDETLLETIDALERGADLATVPGLVFRGPDGALVHTAHRPKYTDLDTLPYPNLDMFSVEVPLAEYRQPGTRAAMATLEVDGRRPFVTDSLLMIMSSRGCAWNCSFCPLSKWEGKTLLHDPEYVVDQIATYVARYGHRTFVFGDNTLSYPKKRLIAICDLIVARGLDIEWICMTRADMVDPDVLSAMARAGCREISYGIESLSPTVQRAIDKKLSVKRVVPAFEMTHAAGISTVIMLMVGNEGESRETLRETLHKLRDIQPDRILIWTTKVYPGTRLWDRAVTEGVIPEGYFDDDFSEAVDYTGENDATELRRLERMLQHRTTWVDLPSPSLSLDDSENPIEPALLMGAWRGAGVVLGGAHDPLARPDLPTLVRYALDNGLRELWLHTDARALGDRPTRHALQAVSDHILAGLIVPFFAANDADHDRVAGEPGALRATRKGVLAWTRDNKPPVRAWAYLDARNVAHAAAWVTWLHAHKIGAISFIFGADPVGWHTTPTSDLPSLAVAGAAVREAALVARELGVEIEAIGLVECVLGRGAETIEVHALGRPFDERLTPGASPVPLSPTRRAEKRLAPACADCQVVLGCEGVWSRYLDARGERELVPCGAGVGLATPSPSPRRWSGPAASLLPK